MRNPESEKEKIVHSSLAYGLTVARLFVAYNMAKRVQEGRDITLPMVAYVGADILDGVIARKLGVDTPGRRFADAFVDRLSVGLVAQQIGKTYPQTRKYLVGIGAREAVVSAANLMHYRNSGEVVQGSGVHKLGTLSLAAFGAVSSYGNANATRVVGSVANVINAGLAIDYVRNVSNPIGSVENGIRKISFNRTQGSEANLPEHTHIPNEFTV